MEAWLTFISETKDVVVFFGKGDNESDEGKGHEDEL